MGKIPNFFLLRRPTILSRGWPVNVGDDLITFALQPASAPAERTMRPLLLLAATAEVHLDFDLEITGLLPRFTH